MLHKQRCSVGDLALILTLACTVLLGFYIDRYEVDLRPTPRVLFNLAGAYYETGDFKNAVKYWKIVVNYKEIYGIDYGNTQPHGRFIGRAIQNLKTFYYQSPQNDPLFKRGR